jgi:crotonyl-CoA reductase
VQNILEAIMTAEQAADPAAELARIGGVAVPDSYRGMVVRADEVDMFDGMATKDKDPRKALHLQEIPTPEVGRARRWSP